MCVFDLLLQTDLFLIKKKNKKTPKKPDEALRCCSLNFEMMTQPTQSVPCCFRVMVRSGGFNVCFASDSERSEISV